MHDWAYVQSIKPPIRFLLVFVLLALACFPQRVRGAASGLNNIPTADTPPNLTLVLQEFSSFGADRKPDHIAGFDNLSGQQAYKCFACRVRKA
jgi:hypothetical protein